ncbi:hypothetical protein V6N13_130631 [Hibiscus sabdariffa]|uniref:Uncharacterized protein n=1 Tax=Hibiscus sabdariffa TaxID=183260 RepID=A0ABR2P0F0_9ROSI
MMTTPLHSSGHFLLHTSVTPLSVYPPQGPGFGSNYGTMQHTPPGSLFATGPSGSGHHAANDDDDDDETKEDNDAIIRRNPRRNRRAPDCGTGGHRRH